MKIIKLTSLAVVMLVSGISNVKAQTADDIMQKHITAMGGVDKWNSIKTLKMTGSINAGGMEVAIKQTMVTGERMRMDMAIMGTNNFIIVTPEGGWAYMPIQPGSDKIIPLPADQVKMQKDQMNLKAGYLMDKSKIKSMQYIGNDTVNALACYKLKVTDNDGNEQTAYIDMSSYYLLRSEKKTKIQDQEQEVAVNFSNFQKLPEGIVMPMTIGSEQGDITFKTIEINKPIDEKIFTPVVPAATQDGETEPPKKEISK